MERLAAAGTEDALAPGRSAGSRDGRQRWLMSVEAVDAPPLAGGPGPRLFRIAVEVTWREGRAERRIELATHRLEPGAP